MNWSNKYVEHMFFVHAFLYVHVHVSNMKNLSSKI